MTKTSRSRGRTNGESNDSFDVDAMDPALNTSGPIYLVRSECPGGEWRSAGPPPPDWSDPAAAQAVKELMDLTGCGAPSCEKRHIVTSAWWDAESKTVREQEPQSDSGEEKVS